MPGDRLTLIGPTVHRFGAGRFYADHDARHPWRLAYLLDRPNGEMTEGFADWLAAEWPVLLPEKSRSRFTSGVGLRRSV